MKKREEARMGDALDEGGIVNVAIAEQPVVPALPVWPAGVVLLVGFAAALTSGTGAAFAADYLDPALRTPEEVLRAWKFRCWLRYRKKWARVIRLRR